MREGRPPGYDGRCRDLTPERARRARGRGPTAFRSASARPTRVAARSPTSIRGEVSVEWSTISDFVIVRSNGTPVFFLANAVDDLDMEITHVLRGEDLIDSTHRVLALRRALGHDDQPVYAHMPLILGPGGASSRSGTARCRSRSTATRATCPRRSLNYLALLGWGPEDGREILTLDELVAEFELERVNTSAATFDPKKLEWMNGEHIRALPLAELVVGGAAVRPHALRRPARHPALRGRGRAGAATGDDARADRRPDGVPLHRRRRRSRSIRRVVGEGCRPRSARPRSSTRSSRSSRRASGRTRSIRGRRSRRSASKPGKVMHILYTAIEGRSQGLAAVRLDRHARPRVGAAPAAGARARS